MAVFCLPKRYVSAFVEALRTGALDPEKLMDMSSAERRSFFEPIVGKENAQDVNALFESKLLLKDQQRGLLSWARSVAGITEKKRSDIVAKISKLDRVLTPEDEKSFLADLAEQKLGVGVSADEARNIAELASKAEQARAAGTENFAGVSNEYLKASGDLQAYIESLKPVSAVKSIARNVGVIARNNLLLNPSTPIKATIGQIMNGAMDAVTRRLGARSFSGLNRNLALQAKQQAWRTFRETGLNTAAMESLKDTGKLGEKNRFDAAEGMLSTNPALHAIEAGVRNVARISNKVAIDWEHNIAFTRFYQGTFYDMLNIASTNLVKGEGLVGDAAQARAAEILKDAARIEPETDVGAMVRMEGQKQAARITATNDTLLARMALEMKDALNKAIPGLGDAVMPIAKIPANIIWNGIENSGLGIPLGLRDLYQGQKKIQSDVLPERYQGMAQMANGYQKLARTFGTLTVAAYFSSTLNKDDFRSDQYGGHFVKIGGVWVNTEYLSVLSPALAGFVAAKRTKEEGGDFIDRGTSYVSGAAEGLKSAPGIDEMHSLVTSLTNQNWKAGIKKYMSDFFTSRGEPAFVQNLMKDRPIDRLFFGSHGVETDADVAQDKVDTQKHKIEGRFEQEKYGLDVWGQPAGSVDHDDPVNQELENIGYLPSYPEQKINGVQLTDDQYRSYVSTAGRLSREHIASLMQLPGWSAFPQTWRLKEIRAVVEHDKKAAADKIKLESMNGPNDIVRAAVNAKLNSMTPEQIIGGGHLAQ